MAWLLYLFALAVAMVVQDEKKTYYRNRATIGRSQLVAAPLRFQAKNRFYVLLML